ncbi:hypothetical protein [Nonomuraea gerenzanensis]|uniref:Uncharacterized protein n=1 Tax=Nonomuraea gerenzanensis TaxID=93944 RepID=A0A1M4BL75_9ACTN|nr:hypothetical protein [Nonomuraea gerenzanensis]UBU10029.1 hypothetical protein LCN96_37510 [Nonomuraea gerenzanensis]SAP16262.1 hypothetical protein BN4615_P10925 [Nonomuraea gerenzanensis]
MATGSIPLPIGAAVLPDGTASNAAPATQRVKSSAATPTPYFLQFAFDAATREQVMWGFRMPADYASAPVLKVQYKMASATSGNVVVEARVAAVSDGDATDVDAKGFGTANTSAATAVPATAGHLDEISLTLTNADSLAAGDFVVLYLARDAANASDTATGDMEVVGVAVTYTTT